MVGCNVQVNPDMISQLETAGLSFVGKDETGRRMEVCICMQVKILILRQTTSNYNFYFVIMPMIQLQIVEMPGHPFFIGAQFHPEFKSRPGKPSPLFSGIFL